MIQALNLPIYSAAVIPAFLGTAVAWYEMGQPDLGRFVLTLAGLVLVQIGINLQNDYFDAQTGVDQAKEESFMKTWSGPAVLASFLIVFSIAIGIGVYLQFWVGGFLLLEIAAIGGLLGFFYSAPPLRLSYRGMGEPITFICFGPLAVLGAYVVQTGELSRASFLVSLPVGFLVTTILYVHHFPQEESDRFSGKKTSVVRLGRRRAASLSPFFILTPYLWVGAFVAASWLPLGTLLFFGTAPLAIQIARKMRTSAGAPTSAPSKYAAVLLHLTGGLALSLGFLIHSL